MRRLGVLALLSVCLASAQSAPGQQKVAILNSQLAVAETAEIKKAQAELEAKFKPRQAAMEKLQKEIADLQQQLQSGQGKLTPQAEQNLNITGTRKQRELQRLGEDLQGDVDRERNEILARTSKRMEVLVRKLAEERGYDVVLDTSNTIFHRPALDITKDVTANYDKAYPAK
ncbi:MAG TPA: OmpH family outer membrane protein [Bryobacteraceae bacterium]|nr:OmpH family outer membrane protein [Bryobacteraceae bacterium]